MFKDNMLHMLDLTYLFSANICGGWYVCGESCAVRWVKNEDAIIRVSICVIPLEPCLTKIRQPNIVSISFPDLCCSY